MLSFHTHLRRYRLLALLVAAATLIAVGVATIWGIRAFSRSTERVEHSYRVMAAIETTEAAVRSAESDARPTV